MDSLSPESRALYEILMADTAEIYESKFAAYKKDRLDAVKQFVADKRMHLQTTVDSRALTVASVDCTPATVPAVAPFDSTPTSVLLSSTATALTTSAASHHVLSLEGDATVDDFSLGGPASPTSAASPRAPSCASSTGGFSKSAAATAAPEKDLHSMSPSTCSTVCLGADTTMSSTSAAAGSASTSTCIPMSATTSPDTTEAVPASTSSLQASSSSTREGLSPGARHLYVYLVGASTNLEDVHDAVDIGAADLAVSAPTTCLVECPSGDASIPFAELTSPATPTSSTTTGDCASEHCCFDSEPAAATPTSAQDVSHAHSTGVPRAVPLNFPPTDLMAGIARHETDIHSVKLSTCSDLGSDNNTCTEDPVDVSLIPGSALASLVPSLVFEAMAPFWCLIKCSVEDTQILAPHFRSPLGSYFVSTWGDGNYSDPALIPWPSFKCNPFGTLLISQVTSEPREQFSSLVALHFRAMSLQQLRVPLFHHEKKKHDKIFGRDQWLCPSWPSPELEIMDCHTNLIAEGWTHRLELVERILLHPLGNLHGTMDNIQLPADWQVLKIVGLKWSAALIVITFPLGVQGAQLKPPVFKCSDILCPATHTLIAITNVDLLLGELLTWVFVNCHFAKAHFQWTLAVQRSTSSSRFLATLIGEATVHQKHSCTRVLADAIHKRWISGHLLRGNPHYSELMKWPSNHSHLHSESRFYAPGHIILICYEPVQWKIPWTIPLLPLKFCFQFYYAQSEFVYIFENFQWTIAWLFSCPLLVKLVELKPWPSLSYQFSSPVSWSCSCQQIGDWLLPCSPQRVFLSSSENFQWEIARLLDLIEWKPRNSGAYLWASYLIASACGPVAVFMWLQFVITCNLSPKAELLANITIELKPWHSWELFPCNSVVTSCLCGALHILISSVLTLECINTKSSPYFEVPIWDTNCIMVSTSGILYSGELYWLLALYSSCDQLVTEDAIYFGSQPLEWKIPWCFCPCHVVLSSKWLRMQPCGPEMMSWEIASSNDRAFTYSPRVLISWDPGGSDHVLATAWTVNPLRFLHLTWDPGGCAQHRLEGKPNLKEGGLSATILHCRWLDKWASILGPVAPKTDYKYIVTCSRVELAWNERTDGLGLEGEDRLGVGRVCACYSFFLLRFLAPSPLFL